MEQNQSRRRNRRRNQPQQQNQIQNSFFDDLIDFMNNQTDENKNKIINNIRNNRYHLQRSTSIGDTPLMYAIMYSSLDDGIIQALVESGQGRIMQKIMMARLHYLLLLIMKQHLKHYI